MIPQSVVDSDFRAMRQILDRMQELTKNHMDKGAVMDYIKPIKGMITEAWLELADNGGVPQFSLVTEHESADGKDQ